MSGNQLMLAGAPGAVANYIEDVFSTYLYTGTGATQTITNGIDLSTKGGLTWFKLRGTAENHVLIDSVRGIGQKLSSNSTAAQATATDFISSYNTTGFTIGNTNNPEINSSNANYNYVSWTFREQPKFFDVVTYTGTGSPRTVSHNLGSAPGCIIVKRYDSTGSWAVWHRSGTQTNGKFAAFLNTSGAYEDQAENLWGSDTVAPDMNASTFGVGTAGSVNSNGFTYVAYLFAHNAGGFGTSGSDNVISCGSYTGDGTSDGSKFVSLGYEPQWLLIKRSNSSTNGAWVIVDNMRGIITSNSAASNDAVLEANSSAAENLDGICQLSATGFNPLGGYSNINGATYIYIAIRRGPMKTPTDATKVFNPVTSTSQGLINIGMPVDLVINRITGVTTPQVVDRLRSVGAATKLLATSNANAEDTTPGSYGITLDNSVGINNFLFWSVGATAIYWNFRRAPGFFDEVCYTGTGSATTFSHNLGVVPEMMIVKARNLNETWFVYSQTLGNTKHIALNSNAGQSGNSIAYWNNTSPTSSVFSVGTDAAVNASSYTYVAYLFASVAGVSKVGSYTGTGTTLQVNCGFTGGSRFVLIKRTDSTGDWYVWDSARGIVAGNDPYLLLNSTAAEVTNTDYVDTYSAGFEISSTAPAAINANGGTYIFLAIA